MARITSIKCERTRNGRAARHFTGTFAEKFGVVFSSGGLILNLTDGERVWHVTLDEAEAAKLGERFDEYRATLSPEAE